MTKQLLFTGLMLLYLCSCNKEESQAPAGNPGNGNTIGNVPEVFSQKVLLELFTGAGQSQSTDGFVKSDAITAAHPDLAVPVYIHFADGMEIAQYTALSNFYSNGTPMTMPSGMINRTPSLGKTILNRTQWQSNFDLARNTTAACGLSLESSINGSDATVIVHCGFNQSIAGDYTLTVYLTEDEVSGTGNQFDQRNAYNATTGHPYAGFGDPITNFKHQCVLRKVLSNPFGDAIAGSALINKGRDTKTYTFSINGYNAANLKVIGFITKTGATATDYKVMNAQVVKLGQTKVWD